MRCSFCGKSFDPAVAGKECRACAMFGGCQKVKCPHCGYEMPKETRLVGWVRHLLKKFGVRSS